MSNPAPGAEVAALLRRVVSLQRTATKQANAARRAFERGSLDDPVFQEKLAVTLATIERLHAELTAARAHKPP